MWIAHGMLYNSNDYREIVRGVIVHKHVPRNRVCGEVPDGSETRNIRFQNGLQFAVAVQSGNPEARPSRKSVVYDADVDGGTLSCFMIG
jgi:hypothetical protein